MRISLVLLFALAAVLGGCGGAQSGASTTLWTSSFDAVTADAQWAIAADLDAQTARAWEQSAPQALQALEQASETLGPLVSLALEPLYAPREAGLDLLGDYTVFSPSVAPVAVMRVNDIDALFDFFRARAGDVEQSTLRVAGVEFMRLQDGETSVDIGGLGDFAVVRVNTGIEGVDVSDEALAGVFGAPPSERWVNSGEYAAARGRVAQPGDVSTFAFLRLAALESTLDTLFAEYRDDAQRADCRVIAERMTTSMPFFSSVGVRTSRRSVISVSGLQLSTAASEQLTDVLANALAPAPEAFDEAAVFLGLGFDLARFLETVGAPATAAGCPGIAAVPGNIAALRDRFANQVERNTSWASGGGAMALFDLELDGMIPSPDLVLALDSRDPVGLSSWIEAQLRSAGAAVSVDETAPFPTIEYNLFFVLRVRTTQLEDRLVISTGDRGHVAASALALAGRDSADFGLMRINGAALQSILDGVLSYLAETNALPPEQFEQIEASVRSNELIEQSEASLRLESGELRLTTEVTLRDEASAP